MKARVARSLRRMVLWLGGWAVDAPNPARTYDMKERCPFCGSGRETPWEYSFACWTHAFDEESERHWVQSTYCRVRKLESENASLKQEIDDMAKSQNDQLSERLTKPEGEVVK